MKYTKINSVGKRVLAKNIEWDTLDGLISKIEEIFLELSFVLVEKDTKAFRLKPDKAFVDIDSISMGQNHKIVLKYGVVNFSRIEVFCSYIFLYHVEEGGDYFSIHKVIGANTVALKCSIENILESIFEDIRLCWKESALTLGDLL